MASRDLEILLKLRDEASQQLKTFGTNVQSFSGQIGNAGATMTSLGASITKVAAPAFAVLSGSLGVATKQSFDQVRAVENARLTMLGFGASVEQVDEQMRKAIAFVRSDQGRLFQREDILSAQAALFGMGVEIDNVADGAITMAKATAAGNGTFDEFANILRRVEGEMGVSVMQAQALAARGVFLDETMRSNITSAQGLLEAMEQVLPDELITNRANSIDGALIRLRSNFRDLGASILGVDTETSTFIEGGFGSTLLQIIDELTVLLAENKDAFVELGTTIAISIQEALPHIINLLTFVMRNFDTIMILLGGATVLGTALITLGVIFSSVATVISGFITMAGLASLALTFLALNPVGLVIVVIASLIAIGWLLLNQWENIWNGLKIIVGSAAQFFWDKLMPFLPGGLFIKMLVDNWDTVAAYFALIWETITGIFKKAGDIIQGIMERIISWAERAIQLAQRAISMVGGAIPGSGLISGAVSAARRAIGVQDAIITPQGQVIQTDPADYLIATKTPGALAGAGMNINITINGDVSGQELIRKVEQGILKAIKTNIKI